MKMEINEEKINEVLTEGEAVEQEGETGEAQVVTFTGEELTGFIFTVSQIIGVRWHKWALSPEEAREVGMALAPVLNKYNLTLFGKYKEELALAFVVAKIVISRMMGGDNDVSDADNREHWERENDTSNEDTTE
jgi:hypothetical protein